MPHFQAIVEPILRSKTLPLDVHVLKSEDGAYGTYTEDGLVGLIACENPEVALLLTAKPQYTHLYTKAIATTRAERVAAEAGVHFIAFYHGAIVEFIPVD